MIGPARYPRVHEDLDLLGTLYDPFDLFLIKHSEASFRSLLIRFSDRSYVCYRPGIDKALLY